MANFSTFTHTTSALPFSFSWTTSTILSLLLAYPILCTALRFRRIRSLERKFGYTTLESLAKLTDHQAHEILMMISDLEFPSLFEKGLQLALFRTYGIPSISRVLVGTRQLSDGKTVGKRYADTAVLIAEIYGNSPTDTRSQDAFARLNYLHGHYIKQGKISNDDLLYTLALFMVEPVRMINKGEWRTLTDLERCALAVFHKSMGDAMEISYDVLPSAKRGFKNGLTFYAELEAWAVGYEKEYMVPHQDNYITAVETQKLLLYTIPTPLHSIVRNVISAAMDDRLRTAVKFDPPALIYTTLLDGFLTTRKYLLRYLALPRPKFLINRLVNSHADAQGRRTFNWYSTLPIYVQPTVMNRWGPEAWTSRLMGVPLPGDSGMHADGFKTADVGPAIFAGKGGVEAEVTRRRLAKERTGGCPFLV